MALVALSRDLHPKAQAAAAALETGDINHAAELLRADAAESIKDARPTAGAVSAP